MPHPSLPSPLDGWPADLPLRLEGVRVVREKTEILRGIDLCFEPRKRAVILGPSGSGKSTLLRLLNRLEDPTSGRLWLGDHPLSSLPVQLLRRAIAVVPQAPRPLPGSVRENLRYPTEICRAPAPDDRSLSIALDEFGLDPHGLDRDASSLSGGERRRLALAVALQTRPELLVADEPTAGLDPTASDRLAEALDRRARRDGLRTIIVTHDRSIAPALGEIAIFLDQGRIIDQGPTLEVILRHDSKAWAPTAPDPVPEEPGP